VLAVVAALAVIEALASVGREVHKIIVATAAAARHEECIAAHPDKLRASLEVECEAACFAGSWVGGCGRIAVGHLEDTLLMVKALRVLSWSAHLGGRFYVYG
jgi:hypothetical protein